MLQARIEDLKTELSNQNKELETYRQVATKID
jgi:hypothetical protein